MWVQGNLLRFLGRTLSTTDITVDVSGVGRLPEDVLDSSPTLSNGRRSALVGELGINARRELGNGTLDKAALSIAGAEEDGVDNEKDPGALLEEEGGANNTEPQGDLEDGNKCHGAIVVLLDELANGV